MMTADSIVGERVHVLMRRARMAQRELAESLSIDQSALSKKLYGTRTWTLDELLMVARVLDVPVTELMPPADYEPVIAGRGRLVSVRPKGFEPPTFCSVVTPAWGIESLEPVESLPRLSSPDVVALLVALVIRQAVRR